MLHLILGLGNPGKEYKGTRHNVGADIVFQFAGGNDFTVEKKHFAKTCRCRVDNTPVQLAVPTVYMNESGKTAAALLHYYDIPPERLLVVHDDIDIDLTEMRFSFDARSGGHRGIDSIIASIGTSAFTRLRIGVSGLYRKQYDAAKYVLQTFNPKQEEKIITHVKDRAVEAMSDYILYGGDHTMNRYNRKSFAGQDMP